jgi:AmiR/NasT family two-component response regulator
VIDQAAGIIMAERSCSPEAAFAELRRRSNHGNVKLAEVARELVSEQSSG